MIKNRKGYKMEIILDKIKNAIKETGNIFFDIENLLMKYNKQNVLIHSKNVSNMALRLSKRFGSDLYKIKLASYLHDISCIIPNENRISVSEILNIEILKEERDFPMIIHQKLSKEIALKIFNVDDEEILNAIECHTTLKSNPQKMDMILFIADKIKWDQKGIPPYLKLVKNNLKKSLENGIKEYLNYIMDNKDKLKVIHPKLLEAYIYFNKAKNDI
jgi:predicted HD superfamily hydrolase involved in NAD metabolism